MRRRSLSKQKTVEALTAYLCLSPFLILFGVFTVYSVIHAFSMSFYDYNVFTTPIFIGLANYIELFGSPLFRKAMANTFIYAVATVTLQTVFALLVANLLNQKIFGRAFFSSSFLRTGSDTVGGGFPDIHVDVFPGWNIQLCSEPVGDSQPY